MKKKKKNENSFLEIQQKYLDELRKFANINLKKYLSKVSFEKKKFDQQTKIIKNRNIIWCPSVDINYKNLNSDSWFDISETSKNNNTIVSNLKYSLMEKKNIEYKAKKIVLKFSKTQKIIVNKWLCLFAEMYNISLKYIKQNISIDNKCLNFYNLRKILLEEKRKLIINSSIKVHDIDYAIKLACTNYKSALKNLKLGYIKKFRIRYWSPNKTIKVMDLEKSNFNNNTIRESILGTVKGYYNGKAYNFNSIDADCKLQKEGNNYYLFVPEKPSKMEKYGDKNKIISIDLGIRTFATCISENKAIKIGENISQKIKNYHKRKENIMNNKEIPKKIKNKNEAIINKKIKNSVEDLHWKSINYLIKNYETIFIGDLNVKSIASKKGNLCKEMKKVALSLSFYKFKDKLKYKCNVNNINLGVTNEWFSSKMCSMCSNIDENLGSNKIYNCKKCGKIIDRDINGARNIYIKSLL